MDIHPATIRLLLVDDEEDFRIAACKALARRGFTVSSAADAIAALAVVDSEPIDVVVLDVKMPGMDGVQLFHELSERWPTLPVIMLTGHATVGQAFDCSRDGVFDYLAKPCDFDDLAILCHRAAREMPLFASRKSDVAMEPIDVLLIDDEVELLTTIAKLLERRGMSVTTALDGVEGLARLQEKGADVVVLDLRMPGMHGLEVLRRIKRDHSEVEVILLTGHPELSLAFQGMREGAFDFAVKPQDVEKLTDRIHAAADKSRANRRDDVAQRLRDVLDGRAD